MSTPVGVLVMAHGTPGSVEEIEPFYTRIRRGRPPSAAQLDDLVRRYEAIGGVSPLAERTRSQVDGVAAVLTARQPGRYSVTYGAKHTEPSIELAASELARCDVSGIVGLVLTPHRSLRGSGEYLQRAADAIDAARPGLPFTPIEQWFDAPGLPELLGRRVLDACREIKGAPFVVFSAHSVPVLAGGDPDPYEEQVERSALLVAQAAGLDGASVPWAVAWQSAGRTDQRWLGPDLLSTLDELGPTHLDAAVVCPVGFVADHLEVLYDLDIEARARAASVGLGFARTASLNDDPEFLGILAGVVESAARTLK
ncbi:MAG TPA: ferrochelatase [Acidimicrobiales bacterium]